MPKLKPSGGPDSVPRAIVYIILFGYGLWYHVFHKKTGLILGLGVIGATILAVILNFTT